MTPEEIIEALVEKFDGATGIIATYLRHRGLDLDSCLVIASCDIVYDQQPLIERGIRTLFNDSKHMTLLRSFATEVERLLAKITPNIKELGDMELPMLYDVTLISEAIEILRHTLNINDKGTHQYLTNLAANSTIITQAYNSGKDVDRQRLALDSEFDKFFDRIETDINRLDFILRFRELRKCANNFSMYNFHESLKGLNRYMKKLGIEPFPWSEEDDDDIDEPMVPSNPRDFFYTGEDVASDEDAVVKASENGHEYFSLGHIHYMHQNFVTEQFHHIDPHDLYAILNLKECNKRLVIRDGEKARVCYFLSEVSNLIRTDLQLNWRKAMCEHLGVSYSTYNSKYTEARDSETKRTVVMREKLEELTERFEELAKAS